MVPDSSVVVDFEKIEKLDLFIGLFQDRILLPDVVKRELADAGITLQVHSNEVVLATDEEIELYGLVRGRHRGLGAGEVAALVIAHTRDGVLLANDLPARNAARQMNVLVAGSLGVLKHAVLHKQITSIEAIQMMEKMYQSGAFFADNLMREFRLEMEREL